MTRETIKEQAELLGINVVSKRTLTARTVIANVLKMYNLKYVSKKGLEEHIASLIEKDLYDSGHL